MSGAGITAPLAASLPYVRIRIAATSAAAVTAWGAGAGAVVLSTLTGASSHSKANADAGAAIAIPMTYASWYLATFAAAFADAGGANLCTFTLGTANSPGAYNGTITADDGGGITSMLATGEIVRVHVETASGNMSALTAGAVEFLIAFDTLAPDVSGVVAGAVAS